MASNNFSSYTPPADSMALPDLWGSSLSQMLDNIPNDPTYGVAGVSMGPASTLASPYQPGFMDNLAGWKGTDGTEHAGWGGTALGAAQGLFNGWMGMKQYGLAKDQFNFQKDSFAKNWEAQKRTVNTQLQDRQVARVASRDGAPTSPYQSVGAYMNQNGIA